MIWQRQYGLIYIGSYCVLAFCSLAGYAAENLSAQVTATGLAPLPHGSTGGSEVSTQTLVDQNLAASRTLYDTSFIAGSDRVTYGSVDPINPSFALEGLANPNFSSSKMNTAEAARIAAMPLSEAFPSHTADPTNQNGTNARHPMQVLAALSVNWLTVLFVCLGLFGLAMSVLNFLHTHDFAAFFRRSSHWLALGCISALMTFLVW